jgi:hypothetical protein
MGYYFKWPFENMFSILMLFVYIWIKNYIVIAISLSLSIFICMVLLRYSKNFSVIENILFFF